MRNSLISFAINMDKGYWAMFGMSYCELANRPLLKYINRFVHFCEEEFRNLK